MKSRRGHLSFDFAGPPTESVGSGAVPGATRESAVSIGELNDTARALVERSFGQFWVRGEIVDFKPHRNGHWYFCLRDRAAQMACVVWSRDQYRIPAPPDDGMQVIGQHDGGDHGMRHSRPGPAPRIAQRIDFANEKITPAVAQRHREKVRRACNPIAAIPDHARSLAAWRQCITRPG